MALQSKTVIKSSGILKAALLIHGKLCSIMTLFVANLFSHVLILMVSNMY